MATAEQVQSGESAGKPGCADNRVPCCDIDCDIMQTTLQQEIDMDQSLVGETSADVETNSALWRHSQAIRFKELDPVEAAATEVIINGTRRNDG